MDITNINHVGMAVRDRDATTARYEAMGFQLTPYSPHSGALKPGAPVQRMGSGNRCVMFSGNYLEILSSEDAKSPAPHLEAMIAHHQGAHIICFDTDDCPAVDRRVRAAGVETSGMIPLQREIDTPDGVRTAKFERVLFSPQASPEGRIQAARHLTPEFIYQPRYITHANGCTQLAEAVIVAVDLEASTRRFRSYIGFDPAREGDAVRFRFRQGTTLTIVGAEHAGALLPGTLLPPLPGIAAVGYRAPDLKSIGERLRSRGFTAVSAGERLLVPAEEAMGVAVLFGH